MANTYRFERIVEQTKALFDIEQVDFPTMRSNPEALEYLRNSIKRLTRVQGTKILNEDDYGVMTRLIRRGRMYMFRYFNPINKANRKILPYYDMFPCIFVLDKKEKYMTGINLHYIPPLQRAYLMDSMYKYVRSPAQNNWLTRLDINIYNIMKQRFSMRWHYPCIKRYRLDRIPGRLMLIQPDHWDIMMQLPVSQFRGSSINRVYRESRQTVMRRQAQIESDVKGGGEHIDRIGIDW